MKNIIYPLIFILFIGCTYNQDKHIKELMTKQPAAYNKTRAVWIVEQSLGNPASDYSLALTSERLEAKIPTGKRFLFAVIDPVQNKIEVPFELEKAEQGFQIFDKAGIRNEQEVSLLTFDRPLLGKPIVYALVSKDEFSFTSAEYLPYPLKTAAADGPTLSLAVTHPMLTRFQLTASDYSPGEKVTLAIRSGDRYEEVKMFANEQGSFSFGVNPTILGKFGGDASIIAFRENGEALTLDYPWGSKLETQTFHTARPSPIVFSVNHDF